MNQAEFIELSGQMPTSDKNYKKTSGGEKYRIFWSFFEGVIVQADGTRIEYDDMIKSIYAGVTVEELRLKQKHSIEHIIPKSFLKRYLSGKLDQEVINGSTLNPFNFAPCHRNINSMRSNFVFDFEDDEIKRSYKINLDHVFHDYGLDYEDEWVVPTKTRGEVARAILYMSIYYGINEYYGGHVKELVKWAKFDAPTFWEFKFNEWVKESQGLNNPFLDYDPGKEPFSPLLSDEELLYSIQLNA